MLSNVLGYFVFALVFGALDFIWLSLAVPGIYRPALGAILSEEVRLGPAALFYFTYVGGVLLFVVAPALETGDWRHAALKGAAFGLVAYATYDLTNLATLKIWSSRVSLIDMAWGALATGLAAGLTVFATYRMSKAIGWS